LSNKLNNIQTSNEFTYKELVFPMLYQKAVDSTKEYIEKDTIKNEDNPVKVKLVFYNH